MKTKIMKAIALCLALVLCFGSAISVSAAEVADAPIDESQKGSLTIFKYDLTGSENAGIWDSSYVSTGVADESGVNETMKNYALEGVEYSFVKVADALHSDTPMANIGVQFQNDSVTLRGYLQGVASFAQTVYYSSYKR